MSTEQPSPRAVPTAGVVVLCNDSVLMVRPGEASRHERGVWGLPAGHVDSGESARQAAIRECEEETGLTLRAEDLIELPRHYTASLARRDGSSELMTWTVFAGERFTGSLRTTPETEPRWVARSSLTSLRLQKNVADAVGQAVRELGRDGPGV